MTIDQLNQILIHIDKLYLTLSAIDNLLLVSIGIQLVHTLWDIFKGDK